MMTLCNPLENKGFRIIREDLKFKLDAAYRLDKVTVVEFAVIDRGGVKHNIFITLKHHLKTIIFSVSDELT